MITRVHGLVFLAFLTGCCFETPIQRERVRMHDRRIVILIGVDPSANGGYAEGHQPWRDNEACAAVAALREFFPQCVGDATSDTEARLLRLVAAASDEHGNATALFERRLGRPFMSFADPVAQVFMTRLASGVWVPWRIVVRAARAPLDRTCQDTG